MTDTVISVEGVSKSYRVGQKQKGIKGGMKSLFSKSYVVKRAVDDMNFTIRKGEIVGFIGPNGAGKSTTIKMLSGILYPDEGKIVSGGYIPYKQRKEYVANIGVVFGQKSQLSWDLPLIDSLELLKYIYKIPAKRFEDNLEKFTHLLDMEDFLNQPVRQLSLGQRMKGDIAAALMHSPQIVFFDEPTIGLDVVAKEKIREFIRKLNQTEQTTMIFTTHDMQDIEQVCKRLIIIDEGKKLYDGSIEDIRHKYATKRSIEVELDSGVELQKLDGVFIQTIENTGGCRKILTFDGERVSVEELMTELLNKYRIKDISIKEPEIDSIIRDIYEGSIQLV